jgi:hypothetical protein
MEDSLVSLKDSSIKGYGTAFQFLDHADAALQLLDIEIWKNGYVTGRIPCSMSPVHGMSILDSPKTK